MNGKVLCIFEERICVATLLGALFFFAHSADAAVVQVHVSGNVSSVLERGLAIGTTGVSPGDTFNMVFEYDLDQGEFLSWPDSIRQSYAEPIVAGPYPGMSAELSIGSLIWSLQSEEMTTEAHVMLDQRESIGSQLFNLRLRTQSETLNGFHAHIFDSSINLGLYDGEEPLELFDELSIPTQNSDINYDAISYVYFIVFSSDPDDWEGNSWEVKLQYDNIDISVIPEPTTLSLLALGAASMFRRRK